MKNRLVLGIAGGAVLLVVFAAGLFALVSRDREAPRITIDNTHITYVEGQDYSTLLKGVSAFDEKDGDVTKSIIVESVTPLRSGNEAKVWYVAKDKSNNITKLDRIVAYVPSPGGGHTDPSQKETSSANTPQGNNGSSSNTQTPAQTTKPAVQPVTKPQTTTQQAQTTGQPNVSTDKAPHITLSAGEASINAGSAFNIVSYVSDIVDDKDDRSDLFRRIIIDGRYDINVPGDYTLNIYCYDSDRNASNRARFVLHVIEVQTDAPQPPPEETTAEAPPEETAGSTDAPQPEEPDNGDD